MTKSRDEAAVRNAGAQPVEESQGFFRDWVVPIVLGLAIGAGLFKLWPVARDAMRSKAGSVVASYDPEDDEANDALAKELRGLGASARGDLVEAMRDLPPDAIDAKIWIARQIAGEPWFDVASLKEILKDAGASRQDRRAAACALLDTQHKEVDTELVLPVLEEWLNDVSAPDRGLAVNRADQMWRLGMLSSQWEARVKHALVQLAKRSATADPERADLIFDERAFACLTLTLGLPDAEVKKTLWTIAKDDSDDDMPRINSIRALSEGGVLDAADVDDWAAVAKATSPVVRQTVADNLFRATAPVYDKVLEPLQFDASPLARTGALDSQVKRRRPTMLNRFDELMEDSYEWVRFDAMFAAGVFKHETENLPARAAMILGVLETSDDPVDVKGAVLALRMLTDETHGLLPTDVHLHEQTVEEVPLRAFMTDTAGRKDAADKWRAKFGAAAVWTTADRVKTLEKVLKHADPKNVERAQILLEKLKK